MSYRGRQISITPLKIKSSSEDNSTAIIISYPVQWWNIVYLLRHLCTILRYFIWSVLFSAAWNSHSTAFIGKYTFTVHCFYLLYLIDTFYIQIHIHILDTFVCVLIHIILIHFISIVFSIIKTKGFSFNMLVLLYFTDSMLLQRQSTNHFF